MSAASVLTHVPEAEKPWPQRPRWAPPNPGKREPSGPARARADTRNHPSCHSEVKTRSCRQDNGRLRQPPRGREQSARSACSPEPQRELLRPPRPPPARRERRCRPSQRPAGPRPGPRPPNARSLGAQGLAELQAKDGSKLGVHSGAPLRWDGHPPPGG